MSHQPTYLLIFPLLLYHFGCQFSSFATDIGSETRPLSNNITLYYTGGEGREKKEEKKGEEGWRWGWEERKKRGREGR